MASPAYAPLASSPSFHDEGHGYDVFGFHPPTLASAVRATAPIYESYFRVDSVGAHVVPAQGPAIVIANHGGVLPIDAAMLCLDLVRRAQRIPRAVADHFVPRLPLVSSLFARLGVVSGTRANVHLLLERGELLVVFPEGVHGTGKRFSDRYRLQHWSVGFAELALRYHAPVIPVAIVGAEESWPLLAKLRGLHMFGSPYLPIPATPLPLPVRYHLRYGTPLHLEQHPLVKDPDDPDNVASAAALARNALAKLVREALAVRRGVFR
jgi:1-acyl-sn-glycerol-3-phosphate acyltransferase